MGQEFGNSLSGGFGPGFPMRLQSESSQGPQLSEDLTGAGESVCNMTHLHSCWQQVSVPCHVELSIGLRDAFVT